MIYHRRRKLLQCPVGQDSGSLRSDVQNEIIHGRIQATSGKTLATNGKGGTMHLFANVVPKPLLGPAC